MGIKHFFYWFKNTFSKDITKIHRGVTLVDEEISIGVDNFMIDLNGLFHNAAQRVYQYGNHKPPPRLLGRRKITVASVEKQKECFRAVCQSIEKLVNIVQPTKRLILCVDGPAPLSKQNQQRQRRFRSALERKDSDRSFDSNSITPGTKWMDYLTKYIDWWIRYKMSMSPDWRELEIVFSNEKAPGEGEHKIINYIRLHGNPQESYCINGADADLIMLALGTHYPKFYLLRDDMCDESEYFCIDIGGVRTDMTKLLTWDDERNRIYEEKRGINDFILMCYLVGNDFLPHIPGVEIIQGGIVTMISLYRQVGSVEGHLTEYRGENVRIVKRSFKMFLENLANYEKDILQKKLESKETFFPDPILESCSTQDTKGNWDVDIISYRASYYETNLENPDMERLCHDYLEGLQWVLTYYTKGVPNWKWRYPYHYAPFAYDLAKYIDTFRFPIYGRTKPTTPFVQLLSVLPPKSAHLIPYPLNSLLTDEKSELSEFCPREFFIDLSGKRQDWEGTVILPMVDYGLVERLFVQMFRRLDRKDTKRNILGKSFVYRYSPTTSYLFKSYYGDIVCNVKNETIEI